MLNALFKEKSKLLVVLFITKAEFRSRVSIAIFDLFAVSVKPRLNSTMSPKVSSDKTS